MVSNIIQWFPGHMAQTRRVMKENLGSVDLVFELLDARIPSSSRNPEIQKILGDKKEIVILNKCDLADDEKTRLWVDAFKKEGLGVALVDSKSGKGLSSVLQEAKRLLKDKIERERSRGMTKPIRAMVVGIPNVGKSTLINQYAGAKKAAAENRPGVTRTKQWVKVSSELELLDMPGVLWPKFDSVTTGENLAITGAIKDAVVQSEEIACLLCSRLANAYPKFFQERYKLNDEELALEPYDLFLAIGKKRGMLLGKGEVNEERCAAMLLEEFRSGKIGKITLEEPQDFGL